MTTEQPIKNEQIYHYEILDLELIKKFFEEYKQKEMLEMLECIGKQLRFYVSIRYCRTCKQVIPYYFDNPDVTVGHSNRTDVFGFYNEFTSYHVPCGTPIRKEDIIIIYATEKGLTKN